ncbi:hypothetical protein GCM10022267_39320 [Lentzea roselyniae]|uniref:Uncharacterized protein n=1 Tax=Lentzea roselyniae TaxID=531940 RepID=A0ABP7B5T8_9PSEU
MFENSPFPAHRRPAQTETAGEHRLREQHVPAEERAGRLDLTEERRLVEPRVAQEPGAVEPRRAQPALREVDERGAPQVDLAAQPETRPRPQLRGQRRLQRHPPPLVGLGPRPRQPAQRLTQHVQRRLPVLHRPPAVLDPVPQAAQPRIGLGGSEPAADVLQR